MSSDRSLVFSILNYLSCKKPRRIGLERRGALSYSSVSPGVLDHVWKFSISKLGSDAEGSDRELSGYRSQISPSNLRRLNRPGTYFAHAGQRPGSEAAPSCLPVLRRARYRQDDHRANTRQGT